MQLNDFDFALPEELIAQQPAARRDTSRLMSLERETKRVSCGNFSDLPNFFCSGDLLVLNDTQVIPARLLGQKQTGGKVEIFLVRRDMQTEAAEEWFCLTKSSRAPKPGTLVELEAGLQGEILEEVESPYRRVRFHCDGNFMQLVEKIGHLPLPPYIKREDSQDDRSRYQTVFAREKGAVAAPTAGLHFTEEILQRLRNIGVEICSLTLHVGLGTFLPVRVEDVSQHKMHSEIYHVPQATADAVNRARREGRRIFALGTTSARTLETAVTKDGRLQAGRGESDIFIYPGYRFKLVDALITNFHLPKSTLLMLVSAFGGREFILSAYRRAVEERFRFFSYGDCMLIY
ncbi:tRNA preQ1(34) S-adenosylmethionine ribosyltransferase-isomerase QueA [Malonomonas rubra]|uniref:tRNA preQ1(34) S-adenosylmethionine ribosyltransferase-isomerase QueA n=1 Tax=Malonomonas rubra TaxID=57040 RepID=UPI0026EA5E0D|nr:tRNA preQ1(34) S-adenosylmethionine ribosyltransferase-isomerase QueA [Malonomonas rubra]